VPLMFEGQHKPTLPMESADTVRNQVDQQVIAQFKRKRNSGGVVVPSSMPTFKVIHITS